MKTTPPLSKGWVWGYGPAPLLLAASGAYDIGVCVCLHVSRIKLVSNLYSSYRFIWFSRNLTHIKLSMCQCAKSAEHIFEILILSFLAIFFQISHLDCGLWNSSSATVEADTNRPLVRSTRDVIKWVYYSNDSITSDRRLDFVEWFGEGVWEKRALISAPLPEFKFLAAPLRHAAVCVWCSRRRRANSRRSSRRLNAASRTAQAKLSVSNLYDLYDSIEMPYSPSVLAPSTPTSIIKHSELLNALPPSEYVPMKVELSCLLLFALAFNQCHDVSGQCHWHDFTM